MNEYLVYGYLLSSPTSYSVCVFTSTFFGSPAPLRTGIEPVTSRLTVARSNQLSYQSFISSFTSCLGRITSSEIRTHEAYATELKSAPFDRSGMLVIILETSRFTIGTNPHFRVSQQELNLHPVINSDCFIAVSFLGSEHLTFSHTGTRTRVCPVKAGYPNHLDYMGCFPCSPISR